MRQSILAFVFVWLAPLLLGGVGAEDEVDHYGGVGAEDEVDHYYCLKWRAAVDRNVVVPAAWYAPSLGDDLDRPTGFSDEETLVAIECLLALQGEKGEASFWGATHMRSSATSGPCGIEVAALYLISYLYSGNWRHGDVVALESDNDEIEGNLVVAAAFDAYRDWFAVVKRIGLKHARIDGFHPLDCTGIYWR